MQPGILYDPAFLDHRCGAHDHPERPERLAAAIRGLKSAGIWQDAVQTTPRPAVSDELHRVHTEEYVSSVLRALDQGDFGNLDLDTFFSPGSRKAALHAAGGGADLALAVQRREIDWGFAVVRPPGHHASWSRPRGFCIFNNIAVAASNLIAAGGVKRVAIIDWDVHHGNGTQDQFWDNPDVLYISLHQWPFYPGSGALQEIGGPEATGKTVNLPMRGHSDDADYLAAFDEVIVPLLNAFSPEHIMVSTGFDGHRQDPLANILLTTKCFAEMAVRAKQAADRLCGGRLSIFLEGGYDLQVMEEGVLAMVRGIRGEFTSTISPHPNTELTTQAIALLKEHWGEVFS